MAKKKAKRSIGQRWTAEEAGRILDEIKALEVTDSAFARQHGLNYGRIASWRQRLGRQQRVRRPNQQRALRPTGRAVAGFVEIKALPETRETRIEVMLRNGRAVHIPVDAPTDALAILLDTIEGRGC